MGPTDLVREGHVLRRRADLDLQRPLSAGLRRLLLGLGFGRGFGREDVAQQTEGGRDVDERSVRAGDVSARARTRLAHRDDVFEEVLRLLRFGFVVFCRIFVLATLLRRSCLRPTLLGLRY